MSVGGGGLTVDSGGSIVKDPRPLPSSVSHRPSGVSRVGSIFQTHTRVEEWPPIIGFSILSVEVGCGGRERRHGSPRTSSLVGRRKTDSVVSVGVVGSRRRFLVCFASLQNHASGQIDPRQ